MPAIFDLSLDELRRRTSAKWRAYPADVIPAWVAEMDCHLAHPVKDALAEFVALGDTGYPVAARYVEAFSGFAGRHWGWTVDPARAVLSADVMMGILSVLLAVTEPEDIVIINDPVYPPFESFPTLIDRTVRRSPMTPEGRIDLAELEETFAEAATGVGQIAYLLCNPHNPTGVVHTAEELAAVADLADRFDVTVISDEVHGPLVYADSPPFTPYLTVAGGTRGFAVHSAAKTFSLAALKAGVVIAGERNGIHLPRVAQGPNASLSGVYAHAAAWDGGDAWLAQLLTELDANRRLVVDQVAATLPGMAVLMPQATYLMWLDCRALDLDRDPARFFLDEARVGLNSGPTFGPRGEGHVRLNIATSPAILTEILNRMAQAVSRR